MEHVWSSSVDAILRVGRPLEDIGVSNWALSAGESLNALDQLLGIGVGILGGDVYEINEASIAPNYDNWYCQRRADESAAQFVERSIAVAKSYIATYSGRNRTVLYALVPSL